MTLATTMEIATSAEKYQGVWRYQSLIVGQRVVEDGMARISVTDDTLEPAPC